MKVLIVAYACEPNKGSEPGVAWNWVKYLSKHVKLIVLTRLNNKELIDEHLHEINSENVKFVYFDLPKALRFWKKGKKGFCLYYFLWQLGIVGIVIKLIREEKIDLIHSLTFGNILLPILFPLLTKKPFIWGPLGGVEKVNFTFLIHVSFLGQIKYCLKRIYSLIWKFSPLFWMLCYKSKKILCKTDETFDYIPKPFRKKAQLFLDIGLDLFAETLKEPEYYNVAQDIGDYILSVGTLEYWRGIHILLYSFKFALDAYKIDEKLVIIGSGPELKSVLYLIKKLKISDKVILLGNVPYEKYLDILKGCKVYLNSSLKEGGVTALLDAIKFNKPVVTFDVGMTARLIPEDCGVKVQLTDFGNTIKNFGSALKRAIDNSENMKEQNFRDSCIKKVREVFSWNSKIKHILLVYSEILHT